MRLYSDDDERRLRLQQRVRDWTRDGLLDASQAAALDLEIGSDLKRTNELLRAALAFFTVIVAVAAVALLVVTFHFDRDDTALATVLAVAAACCFAAADRIAGKARVYRYGVEESLAGLSVALACVATSLFIGHPLLSGRHGAAFGVGAVASFLVYRRFGFVYAGAAAMAFAALIPTQIGLDEAASRAGAAAVFAGLFAAVRPVRLRHGDEFPGDEYALLQAAACAGVYLALNVEISMAIGWRDQSHGARDAFYWSTYAATWIVPASALLLAVRGKDRALLAVGLVEAGVTLATNKPYLGLPRQSWDPILFGLLLVSGALLVKRWLETGVDGQRGGYTADRMAARDREWLTVVSNLSAAVPAGRRPDRAEPPTSTAFQGGRSGGGGAGAGF